MTSAQAQHLGRTVIKNDPKALRPLIMLLYGLRESRGDPDWDVLMADLLGDLYLQTGQWEDRGLKDYVSLAA
jgi:hypothetical protein